MGQLEVEEEPHTAQNLDSDDGDAQEGKHPACELFRVVEQNGHADEERKKKYAHRAGSAKAAKAATDPAVAIAIDPNRVDEEPPRNACEGDTEKERLSASLCATNLI